MDWPVIFSRIFPFNHRYFWTLHSNTISHFLDFSYADHHHLIIATCTLSVITTILIAYTYGISAAANVLEILPKSNLLYIAILLVTIQLCLSHAVSSSALFQNIEEYLHIPKCLYSSIEIHSIIGALNFNFDTIFFVSFLFFPPFDLMDAKQTQISISNDAF